MWVKRVLAVFLLSLCHATTKAEIDVSGYSCGIRSDISRNERIVGGEKTEIAEFPWLVAFKYRGQHNCGGVLISKRWVLTAGHCVYKLRTNVLKVVVGETSVAKKGAKEYSVKNVIIHPNYVDSVFHHDIGLVELSEPVEWSSNVQPICLPSATASEVNRMTVAGWGWLTENGRRTDVLHKVELPLVNRDDCQQWIARGMKRNFQLHSSHICAGLRDGGKDACRADSGGPLMTESQGRSSIVGIVSAGFGCARPSLPGLYTKVSDYTNWIQTQIY